MGTLTAQEIIDTYCSISSGNAVLDFGGLHVLNIDGVTDLQALADDISIN